MSILAQHTEALSGRPVDYAAHERALEIEVDPYHIALSSIPLMIKGARKARQELAYSYRDFRVGGALFAFDSEARRTNIFYAGNTKLAESIDKDCAEMKMLRAAEGDGYDQALAFVVTGTNDPVLIAGVNGRENPTLLPCDNCTNEDMHDSHLVTDDTLVLTIAANRARNQVHSYAELRKLNDASDPFEGNMPRDNLHDLNLRLAIYDFMTTNRQLFAGHDAPAEAARIAMTGTFLEPVETKSVTKEAAEAEVEIERLKLMAA